MIFFPDKKGRDYFISDEEKAEIRRETNERKRAEES